jgi:sugar transferase (PEP-CTERM/EpsH1 system associated)
VRVLFLTHRLPYQPNRGDRVRAFHIVRTLAARVQLELISFVHDNTELEQAARLRDLGVRVTAIRVPYLRNYVRAAVQLGGRRPMTHMLLDAPGFSAAVTRIVQERPPDVVLAYCSGMARFAMTPPLSSYPLVLDLVDVDSQKWAALAAAAAWPKRWLYQREAHSLAHFERQAGMRASATLVVNQREADAIRCIVPEAAIRILPVGVDLDSLRPRSLPTADPRVVFCGVMNYQPNVDGVLWFSRCVWPLVRARRPGARLVVVGSNPTRAIRRLTSIGAGIDVTGTVDDVREHLWTSAVAVAPLAISRGVQNKVLEAIGAGLPIITTPQVFDGLPVEARAACRVADSPNRFAQEILSLLAMTGDDRRAIAARADLGRLSWESQLRPLHGILADAAASTAVAV